MSQEELNAAWADLRGDEMTREIEAEIERCRRQADELDERAVQKHRTRPSWAAALVFGVGMMLSAAAGAYDAAEPPTGFWLYVDGAWKGGFESKQSCDAGAKLQVGKFYQCRPVYSTVSPAGQAYRWQKRQDAMDRFLGGRTRCSRSVRQDADGMGYTTSTTCE